jgi:hypothetical protein
VGSPSISIGQIFIVGVWQIAISFWENEISHLGLAPGFGEGVVSATGSSARQIAPTLLGPEVVRIAVFRSSE